jgi:hypothetical protein
MVFRRIRLLPLALVIVGLVIGPEAKAFSGGTPSLFSATPLIDLGGGLYQNKFAGLLYENANTPSIALNSAALSAAAAVVPLDRTGKPSSSGKIGVVAIGMSNWTEEVCVGGNANVDPTGGCSTGTFMAQAEAGQASGTVNPNIVFVDCAQAGQDAGDWAVANSSAWSECLNNRLPATGLTAKQIEVVLWKEGDIQPASNGLEPLSAMAGSACTKAETKTVDACFYEKQTAKSARLMHKKFRSVKLMFLQSRTYGGYANLAGSTENPEPYAYEYGFATKWLVDAQNNQLSGGGVDKIAGNLNLKRAPVLVWGAYFWASGTTPRSDGLAWLRSDFDASDGTHPTQSGWTKIANLLMEFYAASPYAAPWFN